MVEAKRARTAETPKPPSFDLRSRAPYFYPTVWPQTWRRAFNFGNTNLIVASIMVSAMPGKRLLSSS